MGILQYPCPSFRPFVRPSLCLAVRPSVRSSSLNLVYVTNHLSFVGFYSYLVSWFAMIWACAYYTDFTDGWFCESYSPFNVCLTIRPFAHLVYATSHLSFVAFYSYLVSWLAMIWACTNFTDFMDGWFLRELQSFSCSLMSCCYKLFP